MNFITPKKWLLLLAATAATLSIAGCGSSGSDPVTPTPYAVTIVSDGTNHTASGNYYAGDSVAVYAGTPPTNQKFSGWTATPAVIFAHADSAATWFAMPAKAVTVTATFVPVGVTPTPTQYAVTVSSLGTSPTGNGNYSVGTTVIIKAGTPPTGQKFGSWTTTSAGVNFVHADSATTTFTMPANNVTVTAVFVPIGGDPTELYSVNVSSSPADGGSINISSKTDVRAGTQIPITATANDGYTFNGWKMATPIGNAIIDDTSSASTVITVNGNVVLVADFTETSTTTTYQVQVSRNKNRYGTVYVNNKENPLGQNARFDANTEITVRVSVMSDYKFVNWTSGALPPGVNAEKDTIKFTLTGDVNIQANFAKSDNTGAGAIFYGNRTYMTVSIDELTWMAENLDYEDPDSIGKSWCYDDKSANCKEYGRLYDWNAANAVCPTGWHLPTRTEWGFLARAVGGSGPFGENSGGAAGLKSIDGGWKPSPGIMPATDALYFSGLPGGAYYRDYFFGGGDNFDTGIWWTGTESSSITAYSRALVYDSDRIEAFESNKAYGLSVRCVK